MDIYMDGMTGVEAVRKIREMDETIPIAFTTTSTEHTLESYRLSVLKYLEKPVRQKDINDLLHLVKLQRDSAPRLAIRQNGETQKIPLSELFYLEQKAHHVFLYRRDGGTLQLYGKLSEPAAPAGGAALFSAPTKATASIWPLSGGSTRNISATRWRMEKNVPISRPNRSKAKRAYEDFLFARTRGEWMMEQVFYIFCTTLPGHVLPLALLWHFPWRSRRTALVLMLCNVLCKTAAAAACIANGIGFRGLEILFSFLGFGIFLCCSRLDFFPAALSFYPRGGLPAC